MKIASPLARTLIATAVAGLCALPAVAQEKIKVGFMLPYTGTFAALGVAIENGFKQYVDEQGGKLGGKAIEYVKVDDESDPPRRPTTPTSWSSATTST
jgi:branched-chain amino acid transport system substrate-binding protein